MSDLIDKVSKLQFTANKIKEENEYIDLLMKIPFKVLENSIVTNFDTKETIISNRELAKRVIQNGVKQTIKELEEAVRNRLNSLKAEL